jgi:uncharacterized protein YjbI with pentapeptide repeats
LAKLPFLLDRPGNDFSGIDILERAFSGMEIRKSYFNGCSFSKCDFNGVDFAFSEFSETSFKDCIFEKVDFTNCDFIGALLVDCRFADCSFKNGEWRNSKLLGCEFDHCSFDHTTLTLNEFVGCSVDVSSSKSMEHNSVYQNTFTNGTFAVGFSSERFVSKNYGAPSQAGPRLQALTGVRLGLEDLCFLRSKGAVSALAIYDGCSATLKRLGDFERLRSSTIEFIRLILRSAVASKAVSAATLLSIEFTVSAVASEVDDSAVFGQIMKLVIEIRTLVFDLADSFDSEDTGDDSWQVRTIAISFEEVFSRDRADELIKALHVVARCSEAMLQIVSFRHGSTIIEVVVSGVLIVLPLMKAINLILGQAIITVERSQKLKKLLTKKRPNQSANSLVSRKRVATKRASSILSDKTTFPELNATRVVVAETESRLVQLDTRADIRITVERVQSR